MIGDMHCHTSYSDGSEPVEKVVKRAKEKNLSFIAITDHDTITAFNDIDRLQQKYNIKIIKALEISAYDFKRNRKVHFLCYEPKVLTQIKRHCKKLGKARQMSGEYYIKSVQTDFGIDPKDVLFYAKNCITIYKQHVMEALIAYGYATELYGDLFKQLFGKNGNYPVDSYYIDVFDALDIIKQSGGVCVLAHPYEYDSLELMDELIEQNLIDGIEVYHSRCSEEGQQYLLEIANKHKLIVTGGSDYHGRYNSRPIQIGQRYTDEENLQRILSFNKSTSSNQHNLDSK